MLSNFLPRRYDVLHVVTYFTSIIAFLLVLIVALNNNKITNKCFNRKWLYFIGKISYGIYLYHFFMPDFYNEMTVFFPKIFYASSVVKLPFLFVSSLIFAQLSWVIIEKPILKLKERFNH